MKKIFLFIFFLFSSVILAQNNQNFIGSMDVDNLKNSESSEWFLNYYNSYKPDKEKLEKLKNALPKDDIRFEMLFGAWCADSRREIPRMVKVFESIGLDEDKYDLIGVNKFKDLPEAYEARADEINLDRVPTLIYYKNGKEVNRYVEYAQVSLLDDLLSIVQEEGYEHSYFSN